MVMGKSKIKDKGINPKDLLGLTKLPVRLISPISIAYQAATMNLGGLVKGYGPFNWRRKKVRYSVYLEAAFRHLLLALDGEDADHESLVPHEVSMIACCSIILDAKRTGNLVDDRDKTGKLVELMDELAETCKKQKVEWDKKQKKKKRK